MKKKLSGTWKIYRILPGPNEWQQVCNRSNPEKTGRSCEGVDFSWLSSKVSRTLPRIRGGWGVCIHFSNTEPSCHVCRRQVVSLFPLFVPGRKLFIASRANIVKAGLHGSEAPSPTCVSKSQPLFKFEVFSALQTWFGPSCLFQTNPSKRNPKLKMKTSSEVLNIICMPQESTSRGHCHYKKWS
jgi:hypothetical protein